MKNDLNVIKNLRHSMIAPNTTKNTDLSQASKLNEKVSIPS